MAGQPSLLAGWPRVASQLVAQVLARIAISVRRDVEVFRPFDSPKACVHGWIVSHLCFLACILKRRHLTRPGSLVAWPGGHVGKARRPWA
jgi:hypothetical protein